MWYQLYCRVKLKLLRLNWVIQNLVSAKSTCPFSALYTYLYAVHLAVATTTGGEDVAGLKATVSKLQEQISTKDKIIEVNTQHVTSHARVLSTGRQY